MDNYLIDRETLGKFVDELIKKKALPVNTPEELNSLREESIKSLDDRIGLAIFGSLTDEQNTEFNQLLDRNNAGESDFESFFSKIGLDVERTITDTMNSFGEEFLAGGQNA